MEAKTRRRDREREDDGKAGKAVGPTPPIEDDETAALDELLRPTPPVNRRSRGGTGIGRDLDH